MRQDNSTQGYAFVLAAFAATKTTLDRKMTLNTTWATSAVGCAAGLVFTQLISGRQSQCITKYNVHTHFESQYNTKCSGENVDNNGSAKDCAQQISSWFWKTFFAAACICCDSFAQTDSFLQLIAPARRAIHRIPSHVHSGSVLFPATIAISHKLVARLLMACQAIGRTLYKKQLHIWGAIEAIWRESHSKHESF